MRGALSPPSRAPPPSVRGHESARAFPVPPRACAHKFSACVLARSHSSRRREKRGSRLPCGDRSTHLLPPSEANARTEGRAFVTRRCVLFCSRCSAVLRPAHTRKCMNWTCSHTKRLPTAHGSSSSVRCFRVHLERESIQSLCNISLHRNVTPTRVHIDHRCAMVRPLQEACACVRKGG